MPRGRSSKRRYCVCRSTDVSGDDMIGCDRCDEWFHYKCVGLTEATAPGEDEDYFCDSCRREAEQCRNPRCINETRKGSKYCSDECGIQYNKIRYHKHFRPKMELLEKQHSAGFKTKMEELAALEDRKKKVALCIGELKREKDELEAKLIKIKDHAKILAAESSLTKELSMDESSDEDEEDIISADQSKTYCFICGIEQQPDKAFKHWTSCHRKHESSFISYLTQPMSFSEDVTKLDPDTRLYCNRVIDKKNLWYCPYLEVVCPQHSNWNPKEGEICGCPTGIVQSLALDGRYCLKLKKDCTSHFNWDRMLLANKDYERALAMQKLDRIISDIVRTNTNFNEHYGGVIGVMLHKTIIEAGENHQGQNIKVDMDDQDEQMIDDQL